MNQEFESRGHVCRIERICDPEGRHLTTIYIDGKRYPYSWKERKPSSPAQYAKSLLDSMPEVESAEAPPKTSEPGAGTLLYRDDGPVIL